ncbi:uncharacterized protein LOC107472724 [Arachis duranensis]|uniref:Uncharacterized protein LOC107472724 n=1 Tax=Arachis duranensis TaxID=130453 RepID=A0A6P4C0M9_ARADU|nr:uncharacterized protein LOC107472724 [Arachis duranensis]
MVAEKEEDPRGREGCGQSHRHQIRLCRWRPRRQAAAPPLPPLGFWEEELERERENERERTREFAERETSPYTNRGGRRNSPEEKETRHRASSRQERRYRRRKTRRSFQTHRQHYLATVLNFICLCLCIRFEMTA